MIVIATHNGKQSLIDLISDIHSFGIPNNEICVVDNGSTDISHLKLLEDIRYNGLNVLINPIPGYEIGAFKCAIDNLRADVWFCLQDSIRIKQNIFETIPPKLTDNNVYTFLTFDWPYHVYQDVIYQFLFENYNTVTYKLALYGNMFFAKNSVVQRVKNDWGIPTNKRESMASEIGLGIVFEKHGIEIIGLDVCDERVDVYNGFTSYPFFSKLPHTYRK